MSILSKIHAHYAITSEEDLYKKLDTLQAEISRLLKAKDDASLAKAMELKKQADELFKQIYDVK